MSSDDECRTVCVWERGGVHEAKDRAALARDIADALGAGPQAVEITGVQQGTDGAWLTVQVFAPAVEKNWSRP